ncbi:MAG: cytochrome c [Bdellovibrionaceae bacterium]|nr:cytochrome c [Pseudobdellovibrionaceae bacterium]
MIKYTYKAFLILIIMASHSNSFATVNFTTEMNWAENTPIPENGFQNPYLLNSQNLMESIYRGRIHALNYPVDITGLLIPYEPVKNFFKYTDESDPLKIFFRKLGLSFVNINNLDDLMSWLGLHHYPDISTNDPVYGIPYPKGKKPNYRMGFSLMEHDGAMGFTISCAVCHSANVFGRKILGLTNRFPRANEFFIKGKSAFSLAPGSLFQWLTQASVDEKKMFMRSKENIQFVQAKKPIQLGLDTSLAHVALSLSLRSKDPYATKDDGYYSDPRQEDLYWDPSESKPGVWWNVKFKNKWLLDGSVVSGNPILTNILWNEIGRGSDLKELEQWFVDKPNVIQDLTNAVYHNEAPLFTDFFSAEEHFDLETLKKGEKLYNQMCAKCHGQHFKNWELPNTAHMSFKEQLRTFKVLMPENSKVVNVGTDPFRAAAMYNLKPLNQLAISQNNGIQIKLQSGYVPPPLTGIWARWPYFHNNSVPDLCSLLMPSSERPKKYWAGEAINPNIDFDKNCNGYPLGDKTPLSWKKEKEKLYNTEHRGKSRFGHDERIFIKDGQNLLDRDDRLALVQFLQTL